MQFKIWLIGIGLMAIGLTVLYFKIKYIIMPYNRFVFENSNEHGVVAIADWDAAVKFRKYQAKKEFLETIIRWPSAIVFVIGFLMFLSMTTIYFAV